MGPSTNNNSIMAAQLRQMILYHFDNNLYDNALFLAGRLHCIEPRNPDSIHLLALSHLRLGQHRAAYDYCSITVLKGAHLGCAYVFAQACLALQRFGDGVAALERSRPLWSSKTAMGCSRHDDANRRFLPDAASVYCLLGKLLWANNDAKRAVECYVEALKLNPFMWDAFERLCETNTPIRASAIFRSNPELLAFFSSARQTDDSHAQSSQVARAPSWQSGAQDPFNPKMAADSNAGLGGSNVASKLNIGASSIPPVPSFTLDMETPPPPPPSHHDFVDPLGVSAAASHAPVYSMEPPNAPIRRSRVESSNGELSRAQLGARSRPKPVSSEMGDGTDGKRVSPPQIAHPKRTISGHSAHAGGTGTGGVPDPSAAPQRRSVRLFKKDKDTTLPATAATATATAAAAAAAATTAPTGIAAPIRDLREVRKVRATGTRGRSTTSSVSTVGRVVSGNRKPVDAADGSLKEARIPTHGGDVTTTTTTTTTTANVKQTAATDGSQDREALRDLLELMAKLACGYHALSRYEPGLALQYLQSVSAAHRDSPWVLAQVGKAQYEQNNYGEAERTLARVRSMCPSRMQDMEVYSTVLWHLKKDTELAFLSHELVEADRQAPQAWCSIGNSFSRARDHEQALRCFRRATQLDPRFAYGFTLQGHEQVEKEEYDRALVSYRRAIAADRRHYNGWYGLGKVYERLGKYDMAESHYRRAAEINGNNAIIGVCIGVVLEKQRRPGQALQQYERACGLAPGSAISRFRKAKVLLALRRVREALDEFEQLKDLVPDESNVHFMLGRTYKMLHDRARAIRHFTIAMNLDPKAGPYIKEAMEDLDDDDDEEMDDVDQM